MFDYGGQRGSLQEKFLGLGLRVEQDSCAMLTTHTPPPPRTIPIRLTQLHTSTHVSFPFADKRGASDGNAGSQNYFSLGISSILWFYFNKNFAFKHADSCCMPETRLLHSENRTEQNRLSHSIAQPAPSWLPRPVLNSLPFALLTR